VTRRRLVRRPICESQKGGEMDYGVFSNRVFLPTCTQGVVRVGPIGIRIGR